MINDVFALRREGALDAAAALRVPVVLMHMQGEPRTMQSAPDYDDVVGEVHRFLAERIFVAEMAGIAKKHIVVDPGLRLRQEHRSTTCSCSRSCSVSPNSGVPLLAGLSRKKSIGELTGRDDAARTEFRFGGRACDRRATRCVARARA
jgi:dihydropteroate synthase